MRDRSGRQRNGRPGHGVIKPRAVLASPDTIDSAFVQVANGLQGKVWLPTAVLWVTPQAALRICSRRVEPRFLPADHGATYVKGR
jgi:hypothetical protein